MRRSFPALFFLAVMTGSAVAEDPIQLLLGCLLGTDSKCAWLKTNIDPETLAEGQRKIAEYAAACDALERDGANSPQLTICRQVKPLLSLVCLGQPSLCEAPKKD